MAKKKYIPQKEKRVTIDIGEDNWNWLRAEAERLELTRGEKGIGKTFDWVWLLRSMVKVVRSEPPIGLMRSFLEDKVKEDRRLYHKHLSKTAQDRELEKYKRDTEGE